MHFTFAELLRGFRQRASLDQAALAATLGLHINTVGGWERGLHLPRDREIVMRLAEDLALTLAETDQLLRAANFPPAYDTPNPLEARYQLRAPIADFVGRINEMQQLRVALQAGLVPGGGAIISGVRGMGGIGKTELAYRVANDLRASFPDAQIVIGLRGTSASPLPAQQALQTVIRAFRPDAKLPASLSDLQRYYRSLLHGSNVLILADDARDAAQVRPLIPPTGCALLITSRQRFTLPGMTTIDLEQLSPQEAVAILRQICDRLSLADAQAIAHACGSLPLALRISAGILANDPTLPVATYLARLADAQQRLSQLRDPDDRQLDVEASLLLSYSLMDPLVQGVFRQLGVIVADFATSLAQVVVAVEVGVDVEELLRHLLRHNLLLYDAMRARWRLHDLVRALALRLLEAAGELETVWWRYVQAAVAVAQAVQDQYLAGGDEIVAALTRFDVERPHIDAARTWAAAHAGAAAGDALLVADSLATCYINLLRYHWRREILPQLECALAAARRLGDRPSQATLLNQLGITYLKIGEAAHAVEYFEQCRASAQALGDRHCEGRALTNLGLAYLYLGKTRLAISSYEQALVIVQALGAQALEASTRCNLGIAYTDLGQPLKAIANLEPALTVARTIGNRSGEGVVLGALGDAYLALGEAQRARASFAQRLAITHALGDRGSEGTALYGLGRAVVAQGGAREAIEHCVRAVAIFRDMGDRRQEGYALRVLGAGYAAQGDQARAQATYEQALRLLHAVDDRWAEAMCSWEFGLALAGRGERVRALPLLRAALTYLQEIGHAQAAERAALLARLEAGETFPMESSLPDRAVGQRSETSSSADTLS